MMITLLIHLTHHSDFKMRAVLNKKKNEPKEPGFYLLNEDAEVFAGLRKGYPWFSNNWDDARVLTNDNQVKTIQRGVYFKNLEKYYV